MVIQVILLRKKNSLGEKKEGLAKEMLQIGTKDNARKIFIPCTFCFSVTNIYILDGLQFNFLNHLPRVVTKSFS